MRGKTMCFSCLVLAIIFLFLTDESRAVTSYSNRYNLNCSVCHNMWGSLNGAGASFRMSGYRSLYGRELKPVEKDIELAGGSLAIPKTSPFSILAGAGADYRKEKREASDGTKNTRTGSTLSLDDASIFVSTPLGKHLSVFMEFPMYFNEA
jgi:hypothetical protein